MRTVRLASVLLCTGVLAGCDPDPARASVLWSVTREGGNVVLQADMANWPTDHLPYSGPLSGTAFTARFRNGDESLRGTCQFRGGDLTGTFADDGESFDALEAVYWGPSDAETRVERRWVVGRRAQ